MFETVGDSRYFEFEIHDSKLLINMDRNQEKPKSVRGGEKFEILGDYCTTTAPSTPTKLFIFLRY